MKIQEIKEALNALMSDIQKYDDKYCEDEIRSWFMAAALRIWAGNRLFSEDYVKVLPVFKEQTYTVAQVITALDCAGEESRELDVPAFFQNIVIKDKENNTSESRTFADSIGRFLVLIALINGDFTMEEAKALKGISDLLIGYCDYQGVTAGKNRAYYPEMVTPLNRTSYYQPSSSEKKEPVEGIEKVPLKEAKKTEVINPLSSYAPPMRRTESVTSNAVQNVNLMPEQPNEGKYSVSTNNSTIKKPANNNASEEETLDSVLAELNSLVGLESVKKDVQSLLNFIKICQMRTERGMKVPTVSYHLVFTGNPGTGKTTVARLVAKLYYLMGILPKGHLVETDRSGLIAGYLGQTAIKTQKVIQEALGGVLFIDEAYALANDEQDFYSKEAIETILKAMEDHRDELIVIVAGYDELMHKFIDSNPGLRSRFNKYFHFPDYTGDELLQILKRFCDTNGYALAEDSISYLQKKMDDMYINREEHFGNARAVRNLFEHAINQQANRLVMDPHITNQELTELTLEDILAALEVM